MTRRKRYFESQAPASGMPKTPTYIKSISQGTTLRAFKATVNTCQPTARTYITKKAITDHLEPCASERSIMLNENPKKRMM